jgi:hypothetical protein
MARAQTAQYPLDGGIDQRTHERYVQPPAVLDAVNIRYRQVGGAEARPGCELVVDEWADGETLATTGTSKVYEYRGGLVATDGERIGALATIGGVEQLVPAGDVPVAVATVRNYAATPGASVNGITDIGSPDIAYAGGLAFHVWTTAPASRPASESGPAEEGLIYHTVQDVSSGAYVVSAELLSTDSAIFGTPRVIAVGSAVLAFYHDDASNIWVHVWNSSTRAFGAASAVITDNTTDLDADFDVASDGTSAFVVYKDTSDLVRVRSISAAGAAVATLASAEGGTDAREFGICATAGETIWVTYVIGSGGSDRDVRTSLFSLNLAAETGPFTVATFTPSNPPYGTSVCRRSATTAAILIGSRSSGLALRCHAVVFSTAGAVVGSATSDARTTAWCFPGSKPFQFDASSTKVYAWVYVGGASTGTFADGDQPKQYTFMLVDLGADDTAEDILQAKPVSWVAPRFSVITSYKPSSVVSLGDDKWATGACLFRSAAGRLGLAMATADLAHPGHLASAELGQTMLVSPGWFWDGTALRELSFAFWPQKMSVVTSTGSGTLTSSATYRWRVTYEYTDALGFLHRSQPSDFVEATLGASDNTATLTVPCLTVTTRPHGLVRLVLWRTDGTDQTTYYRVEPSLASNPPAESLPVIDNGSGTYPPETLYTDGGVKPNVMPHGFTAITTYRNRIWIAYGNTVEYSKAFVTGETVSFVDGFTLPLEEAGDVTALWVQDDTLFISTDRKIYYLQGDGPNDIGNLNDIGTPNQVATDRGVADARSVVVTPMGSLYQSRIGIQLLDRKRNVAPEPVGSRVQDSLADFDTTTSALVHPTGSYVTFTCSSGSAGIRLVYDYTADKWSRDLVLESGGNGALIRSAANVAGAQYFLVGGAIYRETQSAFLDDGAWVTRRLSLAWFKPAGLLGYTNVARYTFQTERLTSSDLTITLFADYESTPVESETWLANTGTKQIDDMTIPQIEMTPSRQRAQALRWDLEDATPTGASVGTGAGHVFIGVAVDVDVIGDAFRMPSGQKG